MGKFWTDYPILRLGDVPNEPAPIREIRPISYDGDKYVLVSFIDYPEIQEEIKSGYIYTEYGEYDTVPVADPKLFGR